MKKHTKIKTSPTLTVDPKKCKIHPPGKVYAPKKSEHGLVNFHATAPCTVVFKRSSVFGHGSARLVKGPNKRAIRTEHGRTIVTIKGCEDRMPRSLGAASSPTEIIVP